MAMKRPAAGPVRRVSAPSKMGHIPTRSIVKPKVDSGAVKRGGGSDKNLEVTHRVRKLEGSNGWLHTKETFNPDNFKTDRVETYHEQEPQIVAPQPKSTQKGDMTMRNSQPQKGGDTQRENKPMRMNAASDKTGSGGSVKGG